MRFGSIYLQNYIGIYNGMGLYEIYIDFSKCLHRNIVIRGDNGSGKSTLMKALSVFPDSNESFIPGMAAKKEIILINKDIIYTLTFIHGVKSNGSREVTKAYILKSVNGNTIQLNENGNVSSFKDLLSSELDLDPNFESLSQLSTEDRGIADKKPADRKRFINKILDNLETYNDIYKTLTKRSSSYKNLITSITSKLGSIGDPNVIASNVEAITQKIAAVQANKDRSIEELANAKAKIQMLDPDGSIQAIIQKIEEDGVKYEEDLKTINSVITSAKLALNVSLTEDADILLNNTKARIDTINVDNQIKRGQIESFLKERETEAAELSTKIQRLQSFEQEWRYEAICDEIAEKEKEKQEIETTLTQVISMKNISSFSKDSFILALETLNRIVENVSNLKDSGDYIILSKILDRYVSDGTIPEITPVDPIKESISKYSQERNDLIRKIDKLDMEISMLSSLELRPKECSINTCPFIKDAFIISKSNPTLAKTEALRTLEITETHLGDLNESLATAYLENSCISQFSNFLRDIDRNKSILSKLPIWDVFQDKRTLVDKVFRGDYTSYLDHIYSYISYANLFDQYKVLVESLTTLNNEKIIYESKQDVLDEIQNSIDSINIKLDSIDKQIVPIQSSLAFNDKTLIDLNKKVLSLQAICDKTKERDDIERAINKNKELYNSNINKIKLINDAGKMVIRCSDRISIINNELNPLMHERDRLNHQMRLVDDYRKELAELETKYNLIETIRYYSSPTTGIQLVFMEMYMGNIIQTANHLLSMFFNGQFKIMPFVINESEFRIPCAGEGILNDDISSMSSAQIAMISMILSFSFLYNASSEYNILKLDEIDGPLDGNNRMMFIDVLHNVMDMMRIEQCIMISHNTELQSDEADIIILKSSENNDYTHGNVIWKY